MDMLMESLPNLIITAMVTLTLTVGTLMLSKKLGLTDIQQAVRDGNAVLISIQERRIKLQKEEINRIKVELAAVRANLISIEKERDQLRDDLAEAAQKFLKKEDT